MKIRIYGTGCARCRELFDNAQAALDVAGIDAEIEKVTDLGAIAAAGVLMTPALEIDGRIVASGKVLSAKDIIAMLPETGGGEEGCSCCSCGKTDKAEERCCCEKPKALEASAGCPCGTAGGKNTGCGGGKSSPGRRLLAYILLTFVGVAVAVMLVRENRERPDPVEVVRKAVGAPLVVYYFHGNMRCATCGKFERLTREVVEDQFRQEVADGAVRLDVVNVDLPENGHFVEDFGLTTKSVVLSFRGKSRNLDRIWTVIRQGDDAFREYVSGEIRAMLGEAE